MTKKDPLATKCVDAKAYLKYFLFQFNAQREMFWLLSKLIFAKTLSSTMMYILRNFSPCSIATLLTWERILKLFIRNLNLYWAQFFQYTQFQWNALKICLYVTILSCSVFFQHQTISKLSILFFWVHEFLKNFHNLQILLRVWFFKILHMVPDQLFLVRTDFLKRPSVENQLSTNRMKFPMM